VLDECGEKLIVEKSQRLPLLGQVQRILKSLKKRQSLSRSWEGSRLPQSQ
jgi:hypothetical protein